MNKKRFSTIHFLGDNLTTAFQYGLFCSRYSNNLINERALRLAVSKDKDTCVMILSSTKESTIHEKNIQTRCAHIWGNLSQVYENIPSLNTFKKNIKTITNNLCQCKLFRIYIANRGYND